MARNYQPNSRKTSNQQGGMESDEGLVASTELASELKMAFNQYAKVRFIMMIYILSREIKVYSYYDRFMSNYTPILSNEKDSV